MKKKRTIEEKRRRLFGRDGFAEMKKRQEGETNPKKKISCPKLKNKL